MSNFEKNLTANFLELVKSQIIGPIVAGLAGRGVAVSAEDLQEMVGQGKALPWGAPAPGRSAAASAEAAPKPARAPRAKPGEPDEPKSACVHEFGRGKSRGEKCNKAIPLGTEYCNSHDPNRPKKSRAAGADGAPVRGAVAKEQNKTPGFSMLGPSEETVTPWGSSGLVELHPPTKALLVKWPVGSPSGVLTAFAKHDGQGGVLPLDQTDAGMLRSSKLSPITIQVLSAADLKKTLEKINSIAASANAAIGDEEAKDDEHEEEKGPAVAVVVPPVVSKPPVALPKIASAGLAPLKPVGIPTMKSLGPVPTVGLK